MSIRNIKPDKADIKDKTETSVTASQLLKIITLIKTKNINVKNRIYELNHYIT
jgi:hypothetical protein